MLILDKVEMLNAKHEQLRIQIAENIRIIYMHKAIFFIAYIAVIYP